MDSCLEEEDLCLEEEEDFLDEDFLDGFLEPSLEILPLDFDLEALEDLDEECLDEECLEEECLEECLEDLGELLAEDLENLEEGDESLEEVEVLFSISSSSSFRRLLLDELLEEP